MSGVSTFILNSSASPARSHALSLDPCAYDTLLDTFGLGLTASTPEARASPNGEEEERESDPPAAVDDAHEDDGLAPIERDRLERMRRNGEEMRRMGIVDSVYRLAGGAVGKPKAPEQETEPGDDVIIIEDDDEDADGDVNAEEATRDESGIGYGCKRCRFSKRGCYDSMDGKLKGCRGDAALGPLYLQRESGAPKKRKGIACDREANPIMSPRSKRRRAAPAKYESGAATEAEPASPPKVPPKTKKSWTAAIPGVSNIRLTSNRRYTVGIHRGKVKNGYIGTVDTLKEAVELYNEEAKTLGRPTKELPGDIEPPEPDRILTVIPARKHAPRPDKEKKKHRKNELSTVPGYLGIRVSNYNGRFNATIGYGCKPNRLYLGTRDTLKEAVQLYNEEARKRGKPVYRLPSNHTLEARDINKISTAVPGLANINLLTADGTFAMQFTHSDGSVRLLADTLDEAVKAYNEERVEHRMSTHKITAEHRAVVEEMQRRRKLFVAARSKRRDKLARQPAAAPVTRTHSKVPAPPPAEKTRPARATGPPRPKSGRDARESAPTPDPAPFEMGAAAAEAAEAGAAEAPVTPAPPADSTDVRRLREQVIELQDMNRSLLGIAQRAMSMAAKSAETMS